MKSGIYQIRNIINNKVYIGKSINLNQREKAHFSNLNLNKHSNTYLQNAVNKDGIENFIFEIIEYCEPNLLNEREIYHIETTNSDYNLIQSIDNRLYCSNVMKAKMKKSKIDKGISVLIYSYNTDTKEMIKWDSIKECSKTLNIGRRWIQNILKGKRLSAKNYLFSYSTTFYISSIMKINVFNINDNTNMIFETVNACSEYFKIHKSYIYECIRKSIIYRKKYKITKID